MKAIAQRAGVSQALLHYHFGTKDKRNAQAIERRSAEINTRRHALLDAIDPRSGKAVHRIFAAPFRPPLGPEGRGRSYSRTFAGLVAGGERDSELVRRFYDPTARRFVSMLAEARPDAAPPPLPTQWL